MTRGRAILVGLLLAAMPVSSAAAGEKYALLVSAGKATEDGVHQNCEYWYDLLLMYRRLHAAGFTHENIHVVYGDGDDWDGSEFDVHKTSTHFSSIDKITDFEASRGSILQVFENLTGDLNDLTGVGALQPGDTLFVWWLGHGTWSGLLDRYEAEIEVSDSTETIEGDEISGFLDHEDLSATIKILFLSTCSSAGLFHHTPGSLTSVLHAAAEKNDDALSAQYTDGLHMIFSYEICAALDAASDTSLVWVNEAVRTGTENTEGTPNPNIPGEQDLSSSHPEIRDYRHIAPHIFLHQSDPAAEVPSEGVYSRDYEEDSGGPTSDPTHVWYEGPDLWVRRTPYGGTENQSPEFGQTNHVYARIHDIDEKDFEDVEVEISWCEASAWASSSQWNVIDTKTVDVPRGRSKVVHVVWDDVPAPGDYCLHTKLDHEEDEANGDGRAFMDNNKVQLNVVVQDNLPNASVSTSCVLENPLEEPATVDVVLTRLDRLPRSPRLVIHVPTGLPVRGVDGAAMRTEDGWRRVEMAPGVRRAVLRGVTIPARSKRDAILTVTSPAGSSRGECFVFKVSEEIDGVEKGGVVVRTWTSTEEQVLATVLGRVGRFWGAMNGRFGVERADALQRGCEESRRLCMPADRALLVSRLRVLISAGAAVQPEVASRLGARHERSFQAFLADSKRALDRGRLDEFAEAQRMVMIAFRPLFLGRE